MTEKICRATIFIARRSRFQRTSVVSSVRATSVPFPIAPTFSRQYHRSCRSSQKYSESSNEKIVVPESSVTEVAKALRLVTSSTPSDENNNSRGSSHIYIDCRSEEEQATGIVPGSINIPYPHNGDLDDLIDPAEWLEDIVYEVFDDDSTNKDAPIFVGCKKGPRSSMACEVLIRAGYTNVTNVRGGMMAWSRAELPMAPFTG